MLPLSGIKVVDMAQVVMGPGAAVFLADQGAEVIKVEPLNGDAARLQQASPYLLERGFSSLFLALNRNKRGIALDAHKSEGQEIVHRLARWADVFILNFRAGDEKRFRLDYETLTEINPELIYASITGLGREGPESRLPAYDVVIQARSGLAAPRQDGKPNPSTALVADMTGCLALAYAIMVALHERQTTGKGQRIDIPLLHAALAVQMPHMVWVDGVDSPFPGRRPTAMTSSYQCEDGQWITIVVPEDHQFRGLCRALQLDHLIEDPRFSTNELRVQMAQELFQVLEAIFGTGSATHWLQRLQAEGVPCTKVADREELQHDVQAVANRMFWQQDHPAVGAIKMISPPFRLSNTANEPRLRHYAPTIGENSDEVLHDLGYAETAIAGLRERQVIR